MKTDTKLNVYHPAVVADMKRRGFVPTAPLKIPDGAKVLFFLPSTQKQTSSKGK